LWLAESTIDSEFKQCEMPGIGPVHNGVCATRIEDSFAYYSAIDVYRATDLTPADLDTMRTEFLRLYGLPYKGVVTKWLNKLGVVGGCKDDEDIQSYGCSDLTLHLFNKIRRVQPDLYIRFWGNDFVRPRDITRVIACDRIGNVDGVYAIGDPRSWLTRFVTVPTQLKPHCE